MITVNSNTRHFNIPGSDLVFGVTADSGTERKHFQCPRYVGDNLDLAGCFIRINYRNGNGETDFYLVEDSVIAGDNITFSWQLSPKVTEYKGQIRFVMCAVGPDLKLLWHTTLGTGQVLEGLEPDNSHIVSQTADVVAQLISMVEEQTSIVERVGSEQAAFVRAAAESARTAAVNEIEAKRANSLASIPNDYTALSNTVESLTRDRAMAIVCEADGTAVAVSDASDMSMQGLRIFGRSVQDGVPTPEAPVEIVSVENPAVRVCGKNLLPYPYPQTSKVESGVTFVDNGDGSITANGTATATMGFWFIARQDNFVLPAGSYVLCPFDVPTGTHIDVAVSDDNLTWYGVASATTAPSTFNLSRNVYISVRWYVPEKAVLNNATMRAMLCKEGVDLAYERPGAHKKFSINRTLYGIPVQTGGNYTDSNGQQWICDEVDLERGVYVQRVGVRVLAASGAYRDAASQIDGFYTTYIQHNDIYLPIAERAISDKLPCYPGTSYKTLAAEGVFGNSGVLTTDVIVIRVSNDRATDVLSFNEWIKNNPVTVYYPLSAPIETPLSESEIAAYRNLHSNYHNTTVLNDAGAHMVVKYAADTKLYIDHKITTLMGK